MVLTAESKPCTEILMIIDDILILLMFVTSSLIVRKLTLCMRLGILSAMFNFDPLLSSVSGLNMLCIWCPWRQRFGPGSHYSGRTVEISPPKIPCPYYSMRKSMQVRKCTLTVTNYLYDRTLNEDPQGL